MLSPESPLNYTWWWYC